MRDFNESFCAYLAEESDRLQTLHRSMERINYHQTHLVTEAMDKLQTYLEESPRNKRKAIRNLLGAAVAIMGEFTKREGRNP